MATLVHLADEKDAESIKKNGIKINKYRNGIFCMPVLPNFYVTHQWLRELKRNGVKTLVGVYFKLDNKSMVYASKYNEQHNYITLEQAIKEIKSLEDPLGYELIIERKILPSEITKIKNLPQNIGWRYNPATRKRFCNCSYCLKGSIGAKRIREKYDNNLKTSSLVEIIEKLKQETNVVEIVKLLRELSRKKNKSDPSVLRFLLDLKIPEVDQELAYSLRSFKNRKTKQFLFDLLEKKDIDTIRYATDSLLELYKEDVIPLLSEMNNEVISEFIEEYLE